MKTLANDVKVAIQAWHETLAHYRCDRPLMASEEERIARKVQEVGLKFVLLAFLGAKNEPRPTKDYDPGLYCTLTRVFRPDMPQKGGFLWFVGLGAKAQKRAEDEKAAAERKAKEEAELFSGDHVDHKNAAAAQAFFKEFRQKHGVRPKPADPSTPEEIGAIIDKSLRREL